MTKTLFRLLTGLVISVGLFSSALQASTLNDIRDRGYLLCGVGIDDFGFATRNKQGVWQGFDVDFCRAVATAALQDPEAVQFVPLDSQSRFRALANNEIDLLIRTTTWTFARDVSLKVHFAGTTLHDEQVFLARKKLNLSSIHEVAGSRVCVTRGTTSLGNLQNFIAANGLALEVMPVETQAGRWQAFLQQQCDLMTSERSDLQGGLLGLVDDPERYVILPEVVSREPLGPVVRDDDPQWFDLVRWVIASTLIAEHYQLSRSNIEQLDISVLAPEARRLVTGEGLPAEALALDARWAFRVIRDVGSYAEIYARNFGRGSGFAMPRGKNALWSQGGLLYAPPLR